MVSKCKICGARTSGHRQYCPDCRLTYKGKKPSSSNTGEGWILVLVLAFTFLIFIINLIIEIIEKIIPFVYTNRIIFAILFCLIMGFEIFRIIKFPKENIYKFEIYLLVIAFLLLVGLFFIWTNYSSDKNNFNELNSKNVSINSSAVKHSQIIQLHNFYGQGYSNSPTCKTSFVIENTIKKDVDFKIYYNILYYDHVGLLQRIPRELNLSLQGLETKVIEDESGIWGYHNCNVDQDSIRVIYKPNSQLKCDGEVCLNDGEKCFSDSVCGSGICNIAGFCGTEKIVECPVGLQNCNNESCLEIGAKKIGEVYFCEFECETNYGEDGICKISPREKVSKVIFIVIFLLVAAFIIYIILNDKKLTKIIRKSKK